MKRRIKADDLDFSIKDGKLYFGDVPVESDGHYDSLYYPFRQNQFGIRVPVESVHWGTKEKFTHLEWVTGLDVMSDGKLWIGSIRMPHNPSIEDVRNFIPSGIHSNFDPIKWKLDHLCRHTMDKEWVIVEDPRRSMDDGQIMYKDVSELIIE
ncbi:hypothetical protein ACKGJO_06735 [Gracilimonas sp. Q87]|uniref:hypothetical protein n=1 Tax=Gracilimonas sp. Q87 TaxID=3384766 RepID=UPI00398451C4